VQKWQTLKGEEKVDHNSECFWLIDLNTLSLEHFGTHYGA